MKSFKCLSTIAATVLFACLPTVTWAWCDGCWACTWDFDGYRCEDIISAGYSSGVTCCISTGPNSCHLAGSICYAARPGKSTEQGLGIAPIRGDSAPAYAMSPMRVAMDHQASPAGPEFAPQVLFGKKFLLDLARIDPRAASILLGLQDVSRLPQWAGHSTVKTTLPISYEDVTSAIEHGESGVRRERNGLGSHDEVTLKVMDDGTAVLTIEKFDEPINQPALRRKAGVIRVYLDRSTSPGDLRKASAGLYEARTFQVLE